LLVSKKKLQCSKQKRTKASFFLPDRTQPFPLKQLREKTLRDILRLLSPKALSSDEAIDRSPINAAKPFERFMCGRRFTLRCQHHAPVGGRKCNRVPFRISADRAQ